MGFFAEELSENSGVSIPIPDGHQLQVTHVCLDLDAETTGPVILRAKSTNDEQEYNICVLHAASHRYHEQLNLEFGPEDSPVEFSVDGGSVHLTGNWRWEEDHEHGEECGGSDGEDEEDEEEEEDDEMDEDDDDEPPELVPYPSDDDEEEEEPKPAATKKQKQQEKQGKGAKKNEKAAAEAPVVTEKAKELKTAKNAKKEEEEETAASKSKNNKKRPAAEIQEEESAKDEAPSKKKAAKENKAAAAPAATTTAVPHRLPAWHIIPETDVGGVPVPNPKAVTKKDGLIVTEHVVGKGALPKPGAFVSILYEGLFPETGETFDHRLKRKAPFTFRRGLGHVIKGMDLGIEGMRVGGARELIIPPNLGYGSKGVGDIPGNQTLVFRIQLIGTH